MVYHESALDLCIMWCWWSAELFHPLITPIGRNFNTLLLIPAAWPGVFRKGTKKNVRRQADCLDTEHRITESMTDMCARICESQEFPNRSVSLFGSIIWISANDRLIQRSVGRKIANKDNEEVNNYSNHFSDKWPIFSNTRLTISIRVLQPK